MRRTTKLAITIPKEVLLVTVQICTEEVDPIGALNEPDESANCSEPIEWRPYKSLIPVQVLQCCIEVFEEGSRYDADTLFSAFRRFRSKRNTINRKALTERDLQEIFPELAILRSTQAKYRQYGVMKGYQKSFSTS